MGPAPPIGLRRFALRWRQWLTVLAGAAVIVAMVVVAETAQSDQRHHHRVEVLVGDVRANGRQIGEYTWQNLALATYGGKQHPVDAKALLSQGLQIWGALSSSVNSLKAADHSQMTMTLLRDAAGVYSAGISLLPNLEKVPTVDKAVHQAQATLAPAIGRLDRDSVAAAALQQRIGNQAATRAAFAYGGSLVIGVAFLVLLGFQLYRLRRRSLIVEHQRVIERRTEERIRALVEHSSDIITVVGPDMTVRWQSSSMQRALGRDAEALVGRGISSLVHPDDAKLLESHLSAATSRPGTTTFTARFQHADGGWRHLEAIAENRLADRAIEGVVLSMRDITERKTLEDELRHQAFHDSLTGLANRALFEDRLAHALAGARRHGRPVAVLFLDLDDFKTINDSLGHSIGDKLLRAVAMRIAEVLRVTDTAARLGGDEFAVLLEIMDDERDGKRIADRLLDALQPAFQIGKRELRVAASIGVAVSDGMRGVDELLRNADTAMYAAKDAGKAQIQEFAEGMHTRVLERLELIGELQRAIDHGEFELDYQPIVELQQGSVIGCEALVRWAHPQRGRLAPVQFIGLAEETGLIIPLGAWILTTACAQAAGWQREFPGRGVAINVNVSTRQLHDPTFPETVAAALEECGLAAEHLVLEITESLLPDDDDEISARLDNLKRLGVRIAVDDFGTGYSALSRLQAYPVDMLKIDRSFIDGIENDPGKAQLVRGILNLGESLRMSVVAEGIEQPEQADRLRAIDSRLGQGYLFSRPVPPEQLRALLASGEVLPQLESAEGCEARPTQAPRASR
jgi:diguanylate cyclase (GGDEF)-like protein/PAS domain S-box-containing protein